MKNNKLLKPALLFVLCIVIVLSACACKEKYEFAQYTKDEVLTMYDENTDLFKQVVMAKNSIGALYDKGLVDEYEHVEITSPYDKEMSYFSDEERAVFDRLFELKPYMIKYHRGGLYVEITFINSDATYGYVLSFWTYAGENSESEYEDYKSKLAQQYIAEEIADGCIFWYVADDAEGEKSHTVFADSVEVFISSFSDQSSLASNKVIVFQALSSTKLSFKDYKIDCIRYEPAQNDNGEATSFALYLRWHNRDSALRPTYRNELELKLVYNKDGTDTADVTNGYSRAETADCFTREAKNKTVYLFLIDDNYYCEYFVDSSVSDKEAAAKQLKDFCHELSDIIVAAEGKS